MVKTVPRKKPGPKPKIGDAEQKKVLGALEVGASLRDAADIIGVDYKTLYNLRRASPEFSKGVNKAVKVGKLRLIDRVANSSCWQSAAWMLERKYGSEFGRKDRMEHTGKAGGPVETTTTVKHVIDYDQLRRDLEDSLRGSNGAGAGRIPANGNGKSVHPGHAN